MRSQSPGITYRLLSFLLLPVWLFHAIQHGNKYDPGKQVQVDFDADSDLEYLCFKIIDQGEGFDWHTFDRNELIEHSDQYK